MKSLKLAYVALLGAAMMLTNGCGKSETETPPPLDPQVEPEQQAAIFNRMAERVRSLISIQDYEQARQALDLLAKQKLTPEQQAIVDKLKAQVPPAN